MNKCLNKVRMFDGNIKTKNKIVNTVLIFLFGIWLLIALIISIYSKTPFRASLNVFLFFVGMAVKYHLYLHIYVGIVKEIIKYLL